MKMASAAPARSARRLASTFGCSASDFTLTWPHRESVTVMAAMPSRSSSGGGAPRDEHDDGRVGKRGALDELIGHLADLVDVPGGEPELEEPGAARETAHVTVHPEEPAAVGADHLVEAVTKLKAAILDGHSRLGPSDDAPFDPDLSWPLGRVHCCHAAAPPRMSPAEARTSRSAARLLGSSMASSGGRGQPPGCPRTCMHALICACGEP